MKLAYLLCVFLVPVLCAKDDAVASYVQGQNDTQVDTELTREKPIDTDAAQPDTTPVPNSDQLQYPQDYQKPGQPGQFYPGQEYPGQYNGGQFYPGQSYPDFYGQPFFPNTFPWSFSPQNLYASIAQHNFELSRRIAESINQQMQRTQEMTNAIQENIRNNLYQQALYNYYANYVPFNPNMFVVPQTEEGSTNPDMDSNKETTSNATTSETTEENSTSSSSTYSTSSDYTPTSTTIQEETNINENKEEIAEATTQFVDIVDVRGKDTKDSANKTPDTISTTTAKSKEAKTSPTLTTKNQPGTVTQTTTKPVTTTKAKTPAPKTTTTAPRGKTEKPKPTTTSKPKSTTDSTRVVFRDSDEETDGGTKAIIAKVDPSAPCIPPLVKDKNGKCINSRDNFNGGCPSGQSRAGDDTCQDEV